jgi:hypothetical protein
VSPFRECINTERELRETTCSTPTGSGSSSSSAKAFRRGALWRPDEWPDRSSLPTVGCMLRDHIELEDVSAETLDELLEKGYEATLWEPGG